MHHPDNPASGRVLTKAGFTRTGTTDHPAADGAVVPYETYAIRHQTSLERPAVGVLGGLNRVRESRSG
ncbi:GNAT family N-acetyltransferase, partial [Streptomyces toxytricini]|uniref:GNAT family N-acetyltransferase n=1 Tax=Streptomyces toxytricini TaxID=67369 RepID=UPI00344022FF